MKNYLLTFLLAVLIVLTGISLRHSVARISGSSTTPPVAIGGSPVPWPPPGNTR